MTTPQRRNLTIILILGALSTISPFAIDMYLPAFGTMAAELNTDSATISLSVSSYFIGLAAGQLFYGPLLDRYGRKAPLYAGLGLYILACLACMQAGALPNGVWWLIAFRFIQGLGGCAAQVAATAMVRDFFPIEESAKIFSLLVLILGVSPLLAPTVGSIVAVHIGWKWVFVLLMAFAAAVITAVRFRLPVGHQPDPTIELKLKPIFLTFAEVLAEPQFYTYALAGALSFAGLFTYVAGSSIIFMDGFHVSAQVYGGIFALLAVGIIGGNQVNIFLSQKYGSPRVFDVAVAVQLGITAVFLAGVWFNLLGFYGTLGMIFAYLAAVGVAMPNSSALALAPFSRNAGSAASVMGFIQIGIGAAASTGIGIFKATGSLPVVSIFALTSLGAFLALLFGKRNIGRLITSGEAAAALH